MKLKPFILRIASTATLRKIDDDSELSVAGTLKHPELIDAIFPARRFGPAHPLGFLFEPEVTQASRPADVPSEDAPKHCRHPADGGYVARTGSGAQAVRL
jgi:hypothetical protein